MAAKPPRKPRAPRSTQLQSELRTDAPRRLEYAPLAALRAAKRNPKRHAEQLAESLVRFGMVDPIVWDERAQAIAAGHGRVEKLSAAQARGEEPPEGVLRGEGGKWLVPVVRGWASRDAGEGEAYIIASNKLGETGGWDEGLLASMVGDLLEGPGAGGLGFSELELVALASPVEAPSPAPASDGPPAPALPEELDEVPVVLPAEVTLQTGQLYRLGKHWLLVGESFDEATRVRLLSADGGGPVQLAAVITDPPYAIYGSASGISSSIADDSMVRPFFVGFFRMCMQHLRTFGHVYSFCDWRSWASYWQAAKSAGITAKNMLVWDKGGGGLGANYMNTHELVFFGAKLPEQKAMASGARAGQRPVHRPNLVRQPAVSPLVVPQDVLGRLPAPVAALFQRFATCCSPELLRSLLAVALEEGSTPRAMLPAPRPTGEEREHNAAKPVALLVEFLENSTNPGDAVGEFFCGSGSTLIAAEKCGRRVFALEENPATAQVALRRWERVTGLTAELQP